MGIKSGTSKEKSGEIRLCVDFRNLNRASDKDYYPVPPMEQLLQMVSGSELFSLLDGFSGYNQVLSSRRRQIEDNVQDQMGNLCLQKDALWAYKCWSNVSEGYGHSFPRINWPKCCSIP